MRAVKSIDAATCLAVTAQIAILLFWSRWAHAQHLPLQRGLSWIVIVALASIATTLVHECGHVLFAWCFEIGLLSFSIGPVQLEKWKGKWRLSLHPAGLLTPGGSVNLLSTNSRRSGWEEIMLIGAGAAANLLIGAAAVWAVLHDDWASYQETWQLIALTGSFCLTAGVLNLFPFFSQDGAYSDAARIRQTLAGTSLDELAPLPDSPETEPLPTPAAIIPAAARIIPTPAAIIPATPRIIPTPAAIIPAAAAIISTPIASTTTPKIVNRKVVPPIPSTTPMVTDESMSAALARIAGPAQPSREPTSAAPDPIARIPALPSAPALPATPASEPPAQIAAPSMSSVPPASDPLARIAQSPAPGEPAAALPQSKPAPDCLTGIIAAPPSRGPAPDPVPAPPVILPPSAKPFAAPAGPVLNTLARIAASPSPEPPAAKVVDPLDRILLRQPDSPSLRPTQTVTRIPAAAFISVPARPTPSTQVAPAQASKPLGGPATKAVPAAFARRPRLAPAPLSDPFANIAAHAGPAADAVPADSAPVLP